MASDEFMKSWKRTEGFLRAALSQLSKADEGKYSDEIREFEHYLEHNELELALDGLDAIFERARYEPLQMLEYMAKAAASMELTERQRHYDEQLTQLRG